MDGMQSIRNMSLYSESARKIHDTDTGKVPGEKPSPENLDTVVLGDTPSQSSAKPSTKVSTKSSKNTTPVSQFKNPEKEVTFLFYMNGQYEDLQSTIASAMRGLEETGSDENTNIVAQLGRCPQKDTNPGGVRDQIDGDWSGVRRYYVIRNPIPENPALEVKDWQEVTKKIPRNPIAIYSLGEAFEKAGETDKAEKCFKRAKALGYEKILDGIPDAQVAKWSRDYLEASQVLRDQAADQNTYASAAQDIQPAGNMMSTHSLKDFISWGMQKYPAKHYVLVMMGHGNAWNGSSRMSPSELGMAIQAGNFEANRNTGRNDSIDAIVFNACYMGNLEALDSLRNAADYTVASQAAARARTFHEWPDILQDVQEKLKDGKNFDSLTFVRELVERFEEMETNNSHLDPMHRRTLETFPTLTAIDNSKLDKVTEAWAQIVTDWKDYNVDNSVMFRNFKDSKNFKPAPSDSSVGLDFETLRDIGSIAINLMKDPDVPQKIKDDCRVLREALRNAVVAHQHAGLDMEGSSGLTIWAPANASDVIIGKDLYAKRVPAFDQETNWGTSLTDSLEKMDRNRINEFVDFVSRIANLKRMLSTPNMSEVEIKGLKNRINIMEQEAVALKEDIDLAKPENYNREKSIPRFLTDDMKKR